MPFTRRPLQTTITFVALNGLLCLSFGSVYDFVCDLPYWERRRERLRHERELLGAGDSQGVLSSENN